MSRFGLSQASAIGVDIDGPSIRVVQLARAGQGWRLSAAVVVPRSAPGGAVARQDVEQVVGVLARQGFRGNRVVVALPEEKLVAGMLELPPRGSGAPLDEIARTELAGMHGYDPQAAETVCWDLPVSARPKGPTQAMAVACRHADAEELLTAFDGSGLEVVAIDTRLHAMVRACRPLLSADNITAIVDLEWDRAVLLLVCQSAVTYRRAMAEAATRELVKTLRDKLVLSDESVACLLSEIGLTPEAEQDVAYREAVLPILKKHFDGLGTLLQSPFAYAAVQHQGCHVADVLLTGSGALIPGIADCLKAKLGVGARPVWPGDIVRCSDALGAKSHDPSLVAAIGLAQFRDE